MTESKRMARRTGRLLGLHWAITDGWIDPESSNMSEIARLLGVNRSTVLRDLADAQDVAAEAGRVYARLRRMKPPSDTSAWRRPRNERVET